MILSAMMKGLPGACCGVHQIELSLVVSIAAEMPRENDDDYFFLMQVSKRNHHCGDSLCDSAGYSHSQSWEGT